MKKYFLASLALLSCFSAQAQSSKVLSGDYVNDGKIDVADITYMTEIILGHKEPVYVTVPSVTTDLQFKRQAFVDETGTFPKFTFSEGQGIILFGSREGSISSFSIPFTSIEDEGLSAHSDGGLFSLRQDDTKYFISDYWNSFVSDGDYYTQFIYQDDYNEQSYNGTEKHLYSSDFLLSPPVSFVDGVASFDVYNMSAVVRLSLSGLTPGANINCIDLESDEAIFARSRTMAVTAEGIKLSDYEYSNTNALRLNTYECTVDSDGKCDVYMKMGPADLSGKEFRVKAYINWVPFSATVSGQNMELNHCYTYAASGFGLQANTVSLGDNSVTAIEYVFMPEVSGYYAFTCDAGCDVLDVSMSMTGGYLMQAGTPYRISVYGDGNLNIVKQEFEAFKFDNTNTVTPGIFYELNIPASGFYRLKSASGGNTMMSEQYGGYQFPSWPDYIYLNEGTCIIWFENDDEVSISALSSIALGTANTVEEDTYYTFTIEEEGYYDITTDSPNHVNLFGEEIDTGGDTPLLYYLCPNELEHRIYVNKSGSLTIAQMETPVIELGVDTKVISNFSEFRDANIYKFVVTETGLYQIKTPDGYSSDIRDRGESKFIVLDPGTYFIRFYSWNFDPEQITISISKQEAEILSLNTEHTVQLSTYENPLYYRIQSAEDAYYYLHVGAGCNFEVTNWGDSRFSYFDNNEERFIWFYSNTGDPSITTTTFSMSKADVVDMTIGEPVEVNTSKLYFIRSNEDGEYYFSANDGCHVRNIWGEDLENGKRNLWDGEEMYIYFFNEKVEIATTTAEVKKVKYEELPYNVETTVELGAVYYRFEITEEGNYSIAVGDGCSYEVQDNGLIDYLYPGEYWVNFRNSGNASLTTTTARIGKVEDVAPALALGTEVTATAGMWYKLEVTDEDEYVFSMDPSWYAQIKNWGDYNPGQYTTFTAGTYYIRFNYWSQDAPSSANVTIGKLLDMTADIEIGTEVTATADMWYKLEVTEDDEYIFSMDPSWIVNFKDWTYVSPGISISLPAGTYYISFIKNYQEAPSSSNVTIVKAIDLAVDLELGTTFQPIEHMWYKFVVEAPDTYRFTKSGDWNYEIRMMGNSGEVFSLEPNTYYIRFWREWWSGEEGNVTIDYFTDEEISLDSQTTVSDSEQWYKLSISEPGAYKFTVSNSWTYEIYNRGCLGDIASLSAGKYYVHFYPTDESAGASSDVTISKFETKSITLGENFVVDDPAQYYTLILAESTFYQINVSDDWNVHFLNLGDYYNGRIFLSAGTYTLLFNRNVSESASANVTISKEVIPDINLGEEFVVTEAGKPYRLILEELDWYHISLTEGWTYDIIYQGSLGEYFKRGNESDIITFNRDGLFESPEEAHVTISKGVEQYELSLGDNATSLGKLYTFHATESGFYTFGTTNSWLENENSEYIAASSSGAIMFMYEGGYVTFAGNNDNMSVNKLDELPYSDEAKLGEEMQYIYGQIYKLEITEEGNYQLSSSECSDMNWTIRDSSNNQTTSLSDMYSNHLYPGTYYVVCYNGFKVTINKVE